MLIFKIIALCIILFFISFVASYFFTVYPMIKKLRRKIDVDNN